MVSLEGAQRAPLRQRDRIRLDDSIDDPRLRTSRDQANHARHHNHPRRGIAMTLPRVTITELTRALGALPPSTNLPMAIVAPADDGPLNTPGAYSRVEDLEVDFVGGHLVQLAAYHLANYGGPVVVCRCNTSIDGSAGAPVAAADGTVSAVVK